MWRKEAAGECAGHLQRWHAPGAEASAPANLLASAGGIADAGGVPKWVKMFIGILLLPVCVGTAKAVWLVLSQMGGAERVWLPMLAGAACWIVVFLLLPKPMWVYVFGHELTHAVWTWIFGGSVKGFKAGGLLACGPEQGRMKRASDEAAGIVLNVDGAFGDAELARVEVRVAIEFVAASVKLIGSGLSACHGDR